MFSHEKVRENYMLATLHDVFFANAKKNELTAIGRQMVVFCDLKECGRRRRRYQLAEVNDNEPSIKRASWLLINLVRIDITLTFESFIKSYAIRNLWKPGLRKVTPRRWNINAGRVQTI